CSATPAAPGDAVSRTQRRPQASGVTIGQFRIYHLACLNDMRQLILLSLVVMFAACKKELPMSGSGGLAAVSGPADARAMLQPPPPPPPAAGVAQSKTAEVSAPLDRMIIRNATISLIVRDTAKSIDAITAALEKSGG